MPCHTQMSVKSSRIQITPLLGGKSDGGVCSLLEIGGSRILLDCGCTSIADYVHLVKLVEGLQANGGLDAVLLSHADIHHVGALPCLLGRQGLQDVPVICTLPVFKFGQIVLYDYFLNQKMEGADQFNNFDLDDIDLAFSKIQTVKFSQSATVNQSQLHNNSRAPEITVVALPSGRTIGGSIWRIRCGPAEILYTMDVNLKKEVVLDGASMDLLPTGPALMVVEGASSSLGSKKAKKDKDESAQLISTVMETVRSGGNCLLPCETGGRLLELMQLLGKHWLEHKLGNYHLIVLSHMAHNIPEFARMQLEWMSDTLSRGFYNGKPNPFDLPQISFATSVKEVERKFPGPKVVLATDGSLSCGLSKELLLKWGGDPRCCVLFTDGSQSGSLAAELRSKAGAPPVIATVSRPFKVELVGEELAEYRQEAERQKKLREEAFQRKRRQEELTQLNAVQGLLERDEDEDEDQVRKKGKSHSAFARFAEPNIVMFETKEMNYSWGDYGISNDDLTFQDISTIETKWQKDKQEGVTRAVVTPTTITSINSQAQAANEKIPTIEEIPWKLASSKVKVQFTCEFREFNLGARADLKAIKTLISKVTPARLLVLRGSASDCEAVASFALTNGMESYTPTNGSSVAFQIMSEKLKVQIPQNLLPSAMKSLRSYSTVTASLNETKCSVSALVGRVAESRASSGQEGTRLVKYLGVDSAVAASGATSATVGTAATAAPTSSGAASSASSTTTAAATAAPVEAMEVDEPTSPEEESPIDTHDVNASPLEIVDSSTGVVSVGEVTLNSLKQLIESKGVEVEFRIDASGGVLVCNNEVFLRKVNGNDFVVEGPPVPAYYRARQALYEQFAFV